MAKRNNGNGSSPVLLSATRMKMFLQCKYKYWCNYVLGLPRKPNASFKLGIAVHEALAEAGKIWMAGEKFTAEDIDKIKKVYIRTSAREGIADSMVHHEGLQMVLNKLRQFSNGKILSVEDKFEVTTNEGIILVGAMDKVEEIGENKVMVTDYKTSKYVETQNELKSDIQLSIYDLVASLKYPGQGIILALDYLRHDQPAVTYRTEDQRKEFVEYVLAIYKEMGKLTVERAIPVLNDMCNWCDFTDSCKAYQEAIDTKTFIKKKPEEYTDAELIKDYLDIKSRKYIMDNREKQLKEYIINKIRSTGQDLIGESEILSIKQNSNTSYDAKTVLEFVPMDKFLRMVSVSKQAVDEYLEKNPAGKAKIEATSTKSKTSPFVGRKSRNGR